MDKTRPVEVELLKRAQEVMREILKDEKLAAKFDMDTWGNVTSKRPTLKCATAACALGSLALSKKFPGLKAEIQSGLQVEEWSSEHLGYIPVKKPFYRIFITHVDKNGNNCYDEYAAEAYFNIPEMVATNLFYATEYKNETGPEAIKEFLAKLKDVISDAIVFNKELAKKKPAYKTRGFKDLNEND